LFKKAAAIRKSASAALSAPISAVWTSISAGEIELIKTSDNVPASFSAYCYTLSSEVCSKAKAL
jgi:hypothetical protein